MLDQGNPHVGTVSNSRTSTSKQAIDVTTHKICEIRVFLIKLYMLRVGGSIFNWVIDFLNDRSIQVKIGPEISRRCVVENG